MHYLFKNAKEDNIQKRFKIKSGVIDSKIKIYQ